MHIVSITWAQECDDSDSPYNRIRDAIFDNDDGAIARQGFTIHKDSENSVTAGSGISNVKQTLFQRESDPICQLSSYEIGLPGNNGISNQDFQKSILDVLRRTNDDDTVDAVVVAGSVIVETVCNAIREQFGKEDASTGRHNRLRSIPLLMLYSFEPISNIDNAFFCWFPITTIARNAFDDIVKDCSCNFGQKTVGILMDDNPEETESVFVKDAFSVFKGLMASRGKPIRAIYPSVHDSESFNLCELRKQITVDIYNQLLECDIIFNVGVSPTVLESLLEYAKQDKQIYIYSCNSILTMTSDLNSMGRGVRFKFYDFCPDGSTESLSLNNNKNSFFRFFYEVISIVMEKASSSRDCADSLLEKLRQTRYFTTQSNDIFSFSQTRQLVVPTTRFQFSDNGLMKVGGGELRKSPFSLDSLADLLRYIDREPISLSQRDVEDIENGKSVSRIQEYAKKIEKQFVPSQVLLVLNDSTGGDNVTVLTSCNAMTASVLSRLLKVFVSKKVSEPIQLSQDTDTLENNGAAQFFAVNNDGVLPLNYWQYVAVQDDGDCGSGYHFILDMTYADAWTTRKHLNNSDYLDVGCDFLDAKLLLDIQGVLSLANQGKCQKYCYIIPSVIKGMQGKNGTLGWMVIQTDARLSYFEVKLLSIWSDRFFEPIVSRLHERAIQRANIRSAIGSIMSRNGSHNIGSHVLSALSHNVGTMPDDRVLYQYIQHRMDYIASATTGAPDWSVPTPFVGNLMKMFYSQRHLLEHIAESDGLHAYQYQGKGTQIGGEQKDCVKIVVRRISHDKGVLVGTVKDKDVLNEQHVWMYKFFRDDLAPPQQNDNGNQRAQPDVADKTVRWDNDEAVSIPGGILGQHAFYNIVENVLRNAAKHSWAGKSNEKRNKAKNLEIYVDFEKNQPDETMCFTVGDNMSILFTGDFWKDFFADYGHLLAAFVKPLDGFRVPKEGQAEDGKGFSKRVRLERFLAGKEEISSLKWKRKKENSDEEEEDGLPHYVTLYNYVKKNWNTLKNSKEFLALLKGKPDKDSDGNPDEASLGHRLPVPLHHRQEIVLAEPFIDLETNRLRQSAWGLSEMKISAGYLRRAEVPVIGGLKHPKPGEHPLVVPLGIPLGKAKNDKEAKLEDFCLAYRFWVKLPKDVLIVADDTGKWGRITGQDEWEGIGVKCFTDVFGNKTQGTKGNIGLMADYGFVIVDHHASLDDDVRLKLPFRYLVVDGDTTQASVARNDLEQATTAKDFVKCVYRVWLEHLKKRRFRARDVLIVADDANKWSMVAGWDKVVLKTYGEIMKDDSSSNILDWMSGFGFVVIDHDGCIEPDARSKLPFRSLGISDSVNQKDVSVLVSRENLTGAESESDFVNRVYRAWLDSYDARPLNIKLHIYDEKGGEKGLISDRDIYKVLFRECLHSVLEPITVNYQIGDFDAWQRKALLLVSMYPLNENDDLFATVKEKEGNHGFRIEGLLVKIVQKVRRFWMSLPCSQEMKCDKNQHLLGVYRESLNRSMNSSARPFAIELLKGLDAVQDKAGNGVNSRLCQALDDLAKTPPETTILGEAVKALDVARTTSDVFLRKYEERISTLPSQYSQCKRMEQPKKPKLDFGAFGVDVICDDRGTVADISYNRHATDGAPLYSEPLSGSQTYLNALSNMSDDDSQWAMRLAENGLVRIAIIDERVRAFIAEHGDDIKKTYASMHIAVVDTEKKPDFNQEKAALPDLTKLPFVVRNASDADFDVVVIHQGIIDKWWPNKHGQKEVSDILSSIRKSGENEHGRFVVVTTGRGRPDNIPETAKVLAFSSIEAFLFKRYPEKLNLVNSLMSILPGSPERNDDHD